MNEQTTISVPFATTTREQLIEVLVFLFLIVPSMILSFFITQQGKVSFAFVAVSTIMRDLALLSLVLFFAWRNGEPRADLGWRFTHLYREAFLGGLLYVPFFFLIVLLDRTLVKIGFPEPQTPGPSLFEFQGQVDLVLAVVLVVVVALCEESIFRGYLYSRLRTVTHSTTAALLLTSAIFAMGHGYEGTLGVVTVGIMGLIFNLVYLWRKSLIAPMVMHFLQDFGGIVLINYIAK
jgi:membrane protease YdiL (CAAX protease family)